MSCVFLDIERKFARVSERRAPGMEMAASKFRRIKGYRELPILVEKLKAEVAKLSPSEDGISA